MAKKKTQNLEPPPRRSSRIAERIIPTPVPTLPTHNINTRSARRAIELNSGIIGPHPPVDYSVTTRRRTRSVTPRIRSPAPTPRIRSPAPTPRIRSPSPITIPITTAPPLTAREIRLRALDELGIQRVRPRPPRVEIPIDLNRTLPNREINPISTRLILPRLPSPEELVDIGDLFPTTAGTWIEGPVETIYNSAVTIRRFSSNAFGVISSQSDAYVMGDELSRNALNEIYASYSTLEQLNHIIPNRFQWSFTDEMTGIVFSSTFEEDPNDSLTHLIRQIAESVQDSGIYIRQGKITVALAYESTRYVAYGSSNKMVRGLKEYIIINHKTTRNCIYSSCYHFKLLHESNFETNIFLDSRISQKTIDFLKLLTGKKVGYRQDLSYDYRVVLPLIQNYFANKLRMVFLMNCRFEVYDQQFNLIYELDYLPDKEHLNYRVIHLRMDKGHAQLIIPRKLMNKTPERKKILLELEKHFEGTLKVYRDLGVNGKILKCVDQTAHYIWEKSDGKTIEYEKVSHLEIDLIKKGIMFMEKEFDNYRKIELKENKKKEDLNIVRNLVAFDIETTPNEELKHEQAFMIGLAYMFEGSEQFFCFKGKKCISEFFSFIASKPNTFNNCVFYGHNSGKFDNFIILKEYLLLEESEFLLTNKKFIVINNSLISFDMTLKNNSSFKISFKDSYRMMPMSLSALTKSFKVKSPKQDIDIGLLRLNWEINSEIIEEYLYYDCQGLLEVLIDFRKNLMETSQVDMVTCLTAPSCAINIFLSKFYKPDEYPLYDLPCMLDRILRSSYHGGRVECNFLGCFDSSEDSGIFMYDINSLYPTVMREDLPYGKPTFIRSKHLKVNGSYVDAENNLKPGAYGFIWCRVTSNLETLDETLPRLHAYHDGMRLLFPDFDEATDLLIFTEEIKLSQSEGLGYEYEYLGLMQFERHPWMREFVDYYYELKRIAGVDKNAAKKLIFKLFLNSAYGNFGIKKERNCLTLFSENEQNDYMKIWDRGKVFNITSIEKYTLVEFEDIIEAKACSIYVASAITALARMTQWKFQVGIIRAGHTVLFGDTDSTCFKFNPESGTVRDFINSDFYKTEIIGGIEGVIGKSKDEMVDYVEKVPRETLAKYLEPYSLTLEDNMVPATRVYIAGCKMYFLEAKIEDKIYNKVALKGFRKSKDKDLDENRFKELFQVKGLVSDQVQFRNTIMNQIEPFNIKIQDIRKEFYSSYFKGDIQVMGEIDYEKLDLEELEYLMEFEPKEAQNILKRQLKTSQEPNKKIKLDYTYKIQPFLISQIKSKRKFPEEYLKYYFN